jgi:hypothetical protein
MKVLVLRSNTPENTSFDGFQWPESGHVSAPDWVPDTFCGRGLHGFLWGEGDAKLSAQGLPAKWLVVEVEQDQIIDLKGKVKFPSGNVVFCGDRLGATRYLYAHGAHGKAVMYGTATVGARGTAIVGEDGTATAGEEGIATAGARGTATAGWRGTATAGEEGIVTAGAYGTATAGWRGTATAGEGGTATAGAYGTATAGWRGTATAGEGGIAIVGEEGTATAGDKGLLVWSTLNALDGFRASPVGHDEDCKPGVAYRYRNGRAVRA